jgi:phosphoribosylamine--glycine ligase
LSALLFASATGTLAALPEVKWKSESVVTVVMAAQGYPESPVSGAIITGLEGIENATVFHAGTRKNDDGDIVVSGGRVLTVTASGFDLHQARTHAYEAISHIHFSGEHHRTDIAERAANGEVHVP